MSRDVDRLINSQVLKIANDFQKQRDLISEALSQVVRTHVDRTNEQYLRLGGQLLDFSKSPLFKALEKAATSHEQAISHITSQTFKIVDSINKNERLWRDVVNSPLAKVFSNIQRSQEQLIGSLSLPALLAVSAQITRYIETNLASARFPESFAGQVLEYLHGIYEGADEEAAEQNAATVEKLFEEKSKQLPPSLVTREGLLQILIALMICVYQMREGTKTEQRITDLLVRMQTSIVERLEKYKPGIERDIIKEVYYIVQGRPTRLLSRPAPKGNQIGVLYPNQIASLIKSRGKWLYVQYFDYIDGIPKMGWVLKKYLKRLEEKPIANQKSFKEQMALRLFERGEISSGYGAAMLGMTRWDFIELLNRHGVPFIDYDKEEIRREFEAVEQERKRLAGEKQDIE